MKVQPDRLRVFFASWRTRQECPEHAVWPPRPRGDGVSHEFPEISLEIVRDSNRLHGRFGWRQGRNGANRREFLGRELALQDRAKLPLPRLIIHRVKRRADNDPGNSPAGKILKHILQISEVRPQRADYFLVELSHTAIPFW